MSYLISPRLIPIPKFAGCHLLCDRRPARPALAHHRLFLTLHRRGLTVMIDKGFQILDREKRPPADLRHTRAAPFVNQIAQGSP